MLTGELDAPPRIAPPSRRGGGVARRPRVRDARTRSGCARRATGSDFYTWGDPRCCLPQGATAATLRGSQRRLGAATRATCSFRGDRRPREPAARGRRPAHRHAVRLTRVTPGFDETPARAPGDRRGRVARRRRAPVPALPLGRSTTAPHQHRARQRRPRRPRRTLPPRAICGRLASGRRFRPAARPGVGLSFVAAPTTTGRAAAWSAARLSRSDAREALPDMHVVIDGERWEPERELLDSDRFATSFVVEMEEDGRAQLRFGDGVLGRAPSRRRSSPRPIASGNGQRRQRRRRRADARLVTRPRRRARRATRCPPRAAPTPSRSSRYGCTRRRRSARQRARRHRRRLRARWPSAIPRCSAPARRAAGPGAGTRCSSPSTAGAAARIDAAFEADLRALPRPVPARRATTSRSTRRAFVPLDLALARLRRAAATSASNVKEALLEAFSNRRPAGRPARLLPPRQLHLRAAGLPEPIVARGDGACPASSGSTSTRVPALRRGAGATSSRGPDRRSAGSRSRASTTTRTGRRTAGSSSTWRRAVSTLDGRPRSTPAAAARRARPRPPHRTTGPGLPRDRLPHRHPRRVPARGCSRRAWPRRSTSGTGRSPAHDARRRRPVDRPARRAGRRGRRAHLLPGADRQRGLPAHRHRAPLGARARARDRLRAQPRRRGEHLPRLHRRGPRRRRPGMARAVRERPCRAGTQVQSMPGQSELPQTFETSARDRRRGRSGTSCARGSRARSR